METVIELDEGKNKEYKIGIIHNSIVYASKSEDRLPGLYYPGCEKAILRK